MVAGKYIVVIYPSIYLYIYTHKSGLTFLFKGFAKTIHTFHRYYVKATFVFVRLIIVIALKFSI